MILVPQAHAHSPFQVGCRPLGIIAEPTAITVGLNIGLVYHVKTQLVAQVVKGSVFGVMTGAHRVEVQGFHLQKLGTQLLFRHSPACVRAVLVDVGAPKDEPLPVQFQNTLPDPHFPESHPAAFQVNAVSFLVQHLQGKGVQCGGLAVPQLGDFYGDNLLQHVQCLKIELVLTKTLGDKLRHLLSRWVEQGEPYPALSEQGDGHIGPHPHSERSLLQGLPKTGLHLEIHHVPGRFAVKPHAPVNAVEMPVVLVLQIALGAVPVHLHRQQVIPGLHQAGHVEFRVQLAVFRETSFFSIDSQGESGLHSAEMEVDLFSIPRVGQLELPVKAHSQVVLGHQGGVQLIVAPFQLHFKAAVLLSPGKGVNHIGVHWLTYSVHLPAGRYRHGGQILQAFLRVGPILRDRFRRGINGILPQAVQAQGQAGAFPVHGFGLLQSLVCPKGGVHLHPVHRVDDLFLSHNVLLLFLTPSTDPAHQEPRRTACHLPGTTQSGRWDCRKTSHRRRTPGPGQLPRSGTTPYSYSTKYPPGPP
ncbi:putative uncharacterized protein [Clostridium sp. CAG:1013]|nr:putative uncharacterized protein [Clostridium sp. CAG:1013]